MFRDQDRDDAFERKLWDAGLQKHLGMAAARSQGLHDVIAILRADVVMDQLMSHGMQLAKGHALPLEEMTAACNPPGEIGLPVG